MLECIVLVLYFMDRLTWILDSGAILNLKQFFLRFSCLNECKSIKYNTKTKNYTFKHKPCCGSRILTKNLNS
jgi:hypothetical protein